MTRYGYVRVSSKDQNPDRQISAMNECGVDKSCIFVDKMSGKNFNRPNYKKMLRRLREGDTLIILSIDRLGRNYDEILEQWRFLTRDKKVDIEVIDMPLLNTNYEKDGLTGVFISDLVLQILAYVAETERSFIRQRQAEGISEAKKRGVKFGAEKMVMPEEFKDYCIKWINREITIKEAAKELNLSPSTFYRRCKEIKSTEKYEKFFKK